MEDENIEFGPVEVTLHEIVSLIERASERILTLSDLGVKGIDPETRETKDERFKECIICHMTAKAAKPSLKQLKDLAARLDRMSVSFPVVGEHGKQLAEDMNLASSRIRRMIMENRDETGNPIE